MNYSDVFSGYIFVVIYEDIRPIIMQTVISASNRG